MINLKRGIFVVVISFAFLFVLCGTVKADSAEIKNVNLSLTYPKVGTKFTRVDYTGDDYDQVPEVKITSSNPYVNTYAEVLDSSYNAYVGTINAGSKYTFGIAIGAKDGYYLSENDLNVTVNGLKVTSFNYLDEEAAAFFLNYTYAKLDNPMTVTYKNKKLKYTKLKKKKQVIGSVIVKNAKGTVSYSKMSGNKKISVNKTNGKITVKKKIKRGTYKLKVKVTASGNSSYNASAKIITIKIKVK